MNLGSGRYRYAVVHPAGNSVEHTYTDSFNERFRDECLNERVFISMHHVNPARLPRHRT